MNSEYIEYLKSESWQILRRKVLNRCSGICEKCNTRRAKDVHHLTYERFQEERLEDLLATCRSCHQKEHPDKKIIRGWASISDAAKYFNMNLQKLKKFLIKSGLLEDQRSRRWGYISKRAKRREFLPGNYALDNKFCKEDSRSKCKTILWNLNKLDEIIPSKLRIKKDVPEFYKNLEQPKTKTQAYNEVLNPHGFSMKYNRKKCYWDIFKNDRRFATFETWNREKYHSSHSEIIFRKNTYKIENSIEDILKFVLNPPKIIEDIEIKESDSEIESANTIHNESIKEYIQTLSNEEMAAPVTQECIKLRIDEIYCSDEFL